VSATVGVIAALPAEGRGLAPPLIVRISGIGAAAASAACEALVAAGARALVSWGSAAGLDPELASGTLVLADRIIGSTAGRPDREWADRIALAMRGRVRVVRGALACPPGVLRTPADKRTLAALGAVAADMESSAVAEAARRAGVPWVAVRAIADDATTTVPGSVSASIDAQGRVRLGRLVAALVRQPADVVALPALASGFRRATETLRAVSEMAGPTLSGPSTVQARAGVA
jgi:adenosylhomocysteine nucleosidase